MKTQRERTINAEDIRINAQGRLELSYEWGGENRTFRLYARNKRDNFNDPIGFLESPREVIGNNHEMQEKCTDYILGHENFIEGDIKEGHLYILTQMGRGITINGKFPRKLAR
ncbi:MAG: hypothetical protein AABX03_01040 [Nanoarchaeota archaeon]